MPPVSQNVRRDGHSGLSTPLTVGVCVASLIAALTLGEFSVLPSSSEMVVTDRRSLRLGDIRSISMDIHCSEKE